MILKEIVWLGSSKEDISRFPESIRQDLGFQLYLLQRGRLPTKSKPMKSIGKGVFELKEQDIHGWYRVLYILEVKSKIHILHCFKKQSAKTSKKDLEISKMRLSEIED